MSYYAKNNGVGTGPVPAGAVPINKAQYLEAIARMQDGERVIVDGGALSFAVPETPSMVYLFDADGFYVGKTDAPEDGQTYAFIAPDSSLLKPQFVNDAWVEGEDPAVIAAALIPKSVSCRQGRLALLGAGFLDDVEAAMDAIADPIEKRRAQIEYEADTWERDNAFLQSMWAQLGGTESELDALFVTASSL